MFDKDKHVGHIVFDSLKERPDAICQIDAATGEEETNFSVLCKSVQLARWLRNRGWSPGDVLALSGKNHLQLQIPFIAALVNGLPLTGVDPTYKIDEVKGMFKVVEPKIAFCEPESYNDYVTAAKDLGLTTEVVTFGTDEKSLKHILETYKDDAPVDEFEVANIDTNKVYMALVTSGGTTGVMKVAAMSHDALKYKFGTMLVGIFGKFNKDDHHPERVLHLSSVQWISGIFNLMAMPVLRQTRVQTSAPATSQHVFDIINKYRPVGAMVSPSLAADILRSEMACDLSCLRSLIITGGKVYKDVLEGLRERSKTTMVMEAYGQTENIGPVFIPNPRGPAGNCGKPVAMVAVKLIDPETEKEISEPNVTGELWTKGVCFSGYYNNPEETANAFTEDGWFKTGDLLYRDEDNNYYFVERMKMLIKYRNYHVMPSEIESVLRSHPLVADVCVTCVPHATDGEHAVACVVPRATRPSAAALRELVASKLSDAKQLRGGVVFLDKLPLTHAGKIARGKVKNLVLHMEKEF